MTGRHAISDTQASRPTRESLAEIAALSLVWVVLASLIATLPGLDGSVVWSLASAAGEAVLGHIGWAFGVFVPILLAFYAIVIGGQLAATVDAAKTQRTLGMIAEAMVSSLVPALLLIAIACIAKPEIAGALFVIVPVLGATLFLAVQLGGFIVFERELVLAKAERTRATLRALSRTLRVRSRRPVWIVMIANVVVAAGSGAAIAAFVASAGRVDSTTSFDPRFAITMYATLTAFHTSACLFAVWTVRTASDRLTRILGWLIGVAVSLLFFFVVIPTMTSRGFATGIGLMTALVVSTASTLWQRGNKRRVSLDWTIQGAGSRSAARSIAKSHARTVRLIHATRSAIKQPSLRDRFAAAVGGFRSGAVA